MSGLGVGDGFGEGRKMRCEKGRDGMEDSEGETEGEREARRDETRGGQIRR